MTDIIAVLPEEVKGTGICARIYKEDTAYIDTRTPTLYLDNLYKDNGRRKREMDKKIRSILQINKNLPYMINASHVLFGFKYRKPTYDNQGRGFINVKYVKMIEDNQIVLVTGEKLSTLNKKDSLIQNMNYSRLLLTLEMYEENLRAPSNIKYLTGLINQN